MSAAGVARRLIQIACEGLPEDKRAVRCQEWTAEAAAILDDPETRSRLRREVRALLFAADHLRGARRMARQAYVPRTRVRAYAAMAFPVVVLIAAYCGTHWLPTAHPVRLALFELLLVAGMIYQILRERRYWLTASTDEFKKGGAQRFIVLVVWWIGAWSQLSGRLGLNELRCSVCCVVSAWIVLPLLDRQIFTPPRTTPDNRA